MQIYAMCGVGNSQRGMSLLSVTVGIGLSGILAFFVMRISSFSIAAQRRHELRYALLQTFQTLRDQIDCTATENAAGNAGMASALETIPIQIDLYRKGNALPLIPKQGALMGEFYLLANGHLNGISVKAARLKKELQGDARSYENSSSAADFLTDPLNQRTWDWNYSDQILHGKDITIGTLCGENSRGNSSGGSLFMAYTWMSGGAPNCVGGVNANDLSVVDLSATTLVGKFCKYRVPDGKTLVLTGQDSNPGFACISTNFYSSDVNYLHFPNEVFPLNLGPGAILVFRGDINCRLYGYLGNADQQNGGLPFIAYVYGERNPSCFGGVGGNELKVVNHPDGSWNLGKYCQYKVPKGKTFILKATENADGSGCEFVHPSDGGINTLTLPNEVLPLVLSAESTLLVRGTSCHLIGTLNQAH